MRKSNRGEKTYFFRFDAEKKKQTTSSSLGKDGILWQKVVTTYKRLRPTWSIGVLNL